MRNGLRQSMAWLHTWSGLIAGWVLFAIFVTGTATYYREDITRWMRPEQVESPALRDPEVLARAAEVAIADLQRRAPDVLAWFIQLPKAHSPALDLYWMTDPAQEPGHVRIDPATGAPPAVRETNGGDFFYRFHFELHMPSMLGRWIAGICAMIALIAILSGIVTHRRIFADFFTLRRAKSAQRGWLDAHNVTGVLALPFHLMITYTGIVTLAVMYMPWGMQAAYKGDEFAYFADSGQMTPWRMPAGRPATLAPVGPMVRHAMATIPEDLETLTVMNPSDANAKVVAVFEEPHGLAHQHPQLSFDGTTGAVMETLLPGAKPAVQTFTSMVGLHEAHFAGPALRLLYFLCGLMGAAMIASGLVLWSVARLPKPGEPKVFGLRLVQVLNVATVAGLPCAIAAYFLANRLLPLGLGARPQWEAGAFFAVWIAAAVYALARPHRQAWREVLLAGAGLFLAVPIVNAATTGRHPVESAASGDALYLWFDTAMLVLAAVLAFAGHKAGHVQARRRAGPQPARSLAASAQGHA